jgi:tetratricopeptide (TPR) repeat protein
VILLKNDCEKGEGVDLAKKYEVRVYPTFAMVDGDGAVTDRWAGYPGVEGFQEITDAALADRRTIDEKKKAFAAEPTLALAQSLGRYSESVFASEDAVRYYRTAMDMDPEHAAELRGKVFLAMYYGLRGGAFTPDDVLAEGQAIMAAGNVSSDQALTVAGVVRRVADPEDYKPILRQALAATEGVEGEAAMSRRELEVDAALMIDGDPERALELKQTTLPEGWRDDPAQLNRYAWWCFENGVNLAEAQHLALRGVELAGSDGDKANILDTAAEIAFKRGRVEEAIELQTRAVALAPDRESLKQTLKKFEDGLDS